MLVSFLRGKPRHWKGLILAREVPRDPAPRAPQRCWPRGLRAGGHARETRYLFEGWQARSQVSAGSLKSASSAGKSEKGGWVAQPASRSHGQGSPRSACTGSSLPFRKDRSCSTAMLGGGSLGVYQETAASNPAWDFETHSPGASPKERRGHTASSPARALSCIPSHS